MPQTLETTRPEAVFKAFSDTTRLRIMNLLRGRKELCVCDLIDVLELPQAKVSRHLAYLRRAGLVQARREGQWMHYRLSRPGGALHKRLLDSLSCCEIEEPRLRADREKLAMSAGRCADKCCD
ncbi:MAG: metalloregulator ArsR/SmtB family transcription factor [Planctomycetota bacterium]